MIEYGCSKAFRPFSSVYLEGLCATQMSTNRSRLFSSLREIKVFLSRSQAREASTSSPEGLFALKYSIAVLVNLMPL